ncbi:MAG: MraY family glycosyltransferase [Myxococcaceae bacterium]
MTTFFVAFLVSLMVGAVMTLAVRHVALRFNWLDHSLSSRKVHARPVPRLGGVAIVLAFFAPLVALLIVDSGVGYYWKPERELIVGLFAGGFVIALLGLYDDFRGAGARKKFAVQLAVAVALYFAGFRIELLTAPFFGQVQLGALALPLTVFWIVGVVNAMNLIDGLDGLAGGVAFFAVGTNFVLALVRGDVLLSLCMAALAGALLGFLIFNWNPASIFMGDTGSMFLGFVLAAVSLKTSSKSGTAVAMLVPIIALGLPIMDTLLAIVRRMLLGRPIFSADKEHIHHRLMSRLNLTHRQAVLVLYGICCLLALTALGMSYANSVQAAMLLSGIGIVVAVLMRKLGYLNLKNAAAAGETRKRNLVVRSLVKTINHNIDNARGLQDVWQALRPLSEALNVSRMELRIRREKSEGVTFEMDRLENTALPVTVRAQLDSADPEAGELVLIWRDGRNGVDRD